MVIMKPRGKVVFTDVFSGAYFTFAVSKEGHVYGFGLSNYHQLGKLLPQSLRDLNVLPYAVLLLMSSLVFVVILTGTESTNTCFVPVKLTAFKNSTTSWVGFSGGQHHTLCLSSDGNTFKM